MDEPFSQPPVPRRVESASPTRLPWLFGLLAALLAYAMIPALVERIEYSITRGRERAEVDIARGQLPSPTLAEISRQFAVVAKAIAPSVVHIETEQVVSSVRGDEWSRLLAVPRQYRAQGQGSGVIVDEAGFILTNYHMVENAQQIQVKLSDNEIRSAEIVGLDPATDLAVLKISPGGLIAAQWGDSDALEVGGLVWAVGNPFGLDRSVTFGIISAKSRQHVSESPYQDFLQTDAAVNPGNSGGPLVDASGKIVGINTAIVGRAYQGISFAIPSGLAQEVYQRLKSSGRVERGWLAVKLDDLTPELAEKLGVKDLTGGLVERVLTGGPADKAGIEPGDVIVEWDGHPITDATELTLLIAKTKVGSKTAAVLIRDGAKVRRDVIVEARPAK
ncbi:MAG TPA: trypsin-like peptidase domain-containing protein [Pirellulales bacterium]|nr:trypsin-like peptidase domain-containing protein [Pirellulales bacterium]